jgi:hypothetical protein
MKEHRELMQAKLAEKQQLEQQKDSQTLFAAIWRELQR